MATSVTKPVWTWLDDDPVPVRCGTFSWQESAGEFRYESSYLDRVSAYPLDPLRLRFTRSRRPMRESLQGGIFGVMRDAAPEGYGLSLLESLEGRALDPLERMELSLGDGVGAIEVCDDIDRKLAFRPVASKDFLEGLSRLPATAPPSRIVRDLHGVPGTTLGGERPKMTVMHDDGQLWIAKLQDRGDSPNSPLREYLAMRSAQACGLRVADVEFKSVGSHQVLLVKRFDRIVKARAQVMRRAFASAHTVLGLDSNAVRGNVRRSYPYLAAELQRWCGREGIDVAAMKRELWRRMAFNAVCGNGDDHPRNHGLINEGGWALAPAYDIAPYITFNGSLAMSVTREGHASAARWALMRDCATFDMDEEAAHGFIDNAMRTMTTTWESERDRLGFKQTDAPTPHPQEWLDQAPPEGLPARRALRKRR